MTQPYHFTNISQLLESVKTDRVQIIVICSVAGKEDYVLKKMNSLVPELTSKIPKDWELIGYGSCSPNYGTATFGEGVDVLLHKRNSKGGTITRFRLLSDYTLEQIK